MLLLDATASIKDSKPIPQNISEIPESPNMFNVPMIKNNGIPKANVMMKYNSKLNQSRYSP